MTQEEAASAASRIGNEISQSAISDIERGRNLPSLTGMSALCRAPAWCELGAQDRVWLSTRSSVTQMWSNPIEVTDAGESGCRPTVAVYGGYLHVAYQRESSEPGMAQDIVVAKSVAGGPFTKELVASTGRAERLDPQLHVHGAFFWVDWMQGAGMFGCAEDDSGTWTAAEQVPWADESWIGVESVRREIRRMVVLP